MSIITDTTLGNIKNQIARKNTYLKQFIDLYANVSWDAVQANVRAGLAPELYSVGDELVCHYTKGSDTYDFPWIVVDNNASVYWQDDENPHRAIFLQAKYATLESIPFDAAEGVTITSAQETVAAAGSYYFGISGDTWTKLDLATGASIPYSNYTTIKKCWINDTNIARYGYNRYSMSAIRQWLNSDANAGEWWTAQHIGDIAPDVASTLKGFMAGLDDDFLEVIVPIKIQVATNTVTDGGDTDIMYDKIFLPSVEQMYGSPQVATVEGTYFPYWKTMTGLTSPSNAANNGRKITALDATTTSQSCRLRSAYRGYSYSTWSVYSSGEVTSYGASGACRCAPVVAIS